MPTKPLTEGLEVYRELLDKRGKPVTRTQLGEPITVRLRIRSLRPEPVTNVAVIDLLPGGFEVVGSSLQPGVSSINGVDYVEVREDRAVFFATVPTQTLEINYQIKSDNRGKFVVPPVFAESMYDRNVKGAWRGRKDERGGSRFGKVKLQTLFTARDFSAVWRPLFVADLRLRSGIWASAALPKPPLTEGIDFSTRVRDRNGDVLRVTLTSDQKYRIWTPLHDISPALIDATVQFEDKYFAQHPGVNPVPVLRAAWNLARSGRARAGASTITMQLARLRFHLHTRTLAGKWRQILCAMELERHYSKHEILEAYLNLVPYGRNIEGAGAASEIYFGKTAARLTEPEAIALSVIPQSPTRRALIVGRENAALTAAQQRWSARAGEHDARELSTEMFRAEARTRTGFSAPHFVRCVLEGKSKEPEIITTLDLSLQQILERRVTNYIAQNRRRGIDNAAALLIDFRTMEVLGQVGSADFPAREIQGQVDGTRRPRSPGSTLKPFVYALALEQGRIHPLTLLKDAPRRFGDYNPENFDREFVGPIRACDALARSRNVPAVALASGIIASDTLRILAQRGCFLPRPESYLRTLIAARRRRSDHGRFGAALRGARE